MILGLWSLPTDEHRNDQKLPFLWQSGLISVSAKALCTFMPWPFVGLPFFLWPGQDSYNNFTEMSKSRIRSALQRNVSFFILVGLCAYTIEGSSVFLTGYLEDYPSSSLSSLRHLSMDLILSTEWSESQLSALCFSSPQLKLSSLLLWSYLPLTYSQSSVASYLVTCSIYLNLTWKMPPCSSCPQGFTSHRDSLLIPLDTGKFPWPAAHSLAWA